jgi:uncharacterized protein
MWTAFLLGVGGSLHCAGMCTPLMMSVTQSKRGWGSRVIYNVGRLCTYALLGFFVASIGSLVNLAAYQHILAMVLGTLLILAGLGTVSSWRIPVLTPAVNQLLIFIKKRFASVLHKKNGRALYMLGMLNGLLPCGLTYAVLSYTLTLHTGWQGLLFMAVFGLGTLPVMLGLPVVLGFVNRYAKVSASRMATIVMISMGVLLLGRAVLSHQHMDSNPILSVSEPSICR